MIKTDAAVFDIEIRMFRIDKISFLLQHLSHTLGTGTAHGDHNKDHGQHHQAHQDIHTVGQKAHQLTSGQCILYNHLGTQPGDQDNTGIYCQLHDGIISHNNALCPHKHTVYIFAGLVKTVLFIILTHISLHHTDRGNIFLYAGI